MKAVIDSVARIKDATPALRAACLKRLRDLEELGSLPAGLLGGESGDALIFPRGAADGLAGLGVTGFLDQRVQGSVLDVSLEESKLDDRSKYQKPFLEQCLAKREEGILAAPTGAGKTVLIAMMLARLRTPALVVCHRAIIAEQIRSTIRSLLSFELGVIGDGVRDVRPITVGMIQSVRSSDPVLKSVGALIVDEAHHCAAPSYIKLLAHCPARYRYGLTATIRMSGQKEKIVFAALGPLLGEIPVKELQEAGHLNRGRYRVVTTTAVASMLSFVKDRCWYYKKLQKDPGAKPCPAPCTYPKDDDIDKCVMKKGYYTWVYKTLSEDRLRNDRILEEVLGVVSEHPWTVVLTHLRDHATLLSEELRKADLPRVFLALGGGSKKDKTAREKAIAEYGQSGGVLVATSGAVGEGFNAPKTSCLVRAMPSGGKVPVRQHTGRIMRPQEKPSLIVDFVDFQVPWLKGMWWARRSIYHSIGFEAEKQKPS